MGTIIRFPGETRVARAGRAQAQSETGTIVILPVIRIERIPDPADGIEPPRTAPGRKRRRRTSAP
jgi:hypothetical protein